MSVKIPFFLFWNVMFGPESWSRLRFSYRRRKRTEFAPSSKETPRKHTAGCENKPPRNRRNRRCLVLVLPSVTSNQKKYFSTKKWYGSPVCSEKLSRCHSRTIT